MSMNYKPTRDESENVVRMLCDQYQKTFFQIAKQRRPLKPNIIDDLRKDGFPVETELLEAAFHWYTTHIGYSGYALATAGVKRVDLKGKEVGTVTEAEAAAARVKIREFLQMKRSASPVSVMSTLYANGEISDDSVKKLDVPQPRTVADFRPRSLVAVAVPEFAGLFEVLQAANNAVSGITDPIMRPAVAKASLDVVLKHFREVRERMDAAA
jgi:sRNA-binding protein